MPKNSLLLVRLFAKRLSFLSFKPPCPGKLVISFTLGRVALYGIFFDFNQADIKPESKPALQEIAKLLKQEPGLKLHVVGHTDNVGGYEFNLSLSKRRAGAVVGALTQEYGIAASRLTPNGVAYLAPVAVNTTEEGRAKNRRVELVPR